MMNQNHGCGCSRCNRSCEGERISVGRGGFANDRCRNNGRCQCQNTCRPRTCCHPCRAKQCAPRPCCERNCEDRAREVFRNEVENAREELRCNLRNCRREHDCRCRENCDNNCRCRENCDNNCRCRENRSTDDRCCDTRNNTCQYHEHRCGCNRNLSNDEFRCGCGCRSGWEEESDDVNDQIYRTQTVGMAYVPGQRWKCPMEKEEGFCKGTIFQDLYKPFEGECK